MPLVWNLPEWLLPVNHPFCLGQELKQDRLKKKICCNFILESDEYKDTQRPCEEQKSWIFHFPSFIFQTYWKMEQMLFLLCKQTALCCLASEYLYQLSAIEPLLGKITGKTLQHLNIDPKKKLRCFHFYFFILLPLSTLLPLMRRWACLEFREPILLPDSNFPQSCKATHHSSAKNKSKYDYGAVQGAKHFILDK